MSQSKRLALITFLFTLVMGGVLIGATFAIAQEKPLDVGLTPIQPALGLAAFDIRIVVAKIIRAVLALLGLVALVLMLYAGYTWMTAAGNEEKIEQAKKILVNATIGLAIIFSSYAIVSFVIGKLVEATIQGQGGGGGGGGGNNPYFPRDAFYVDQLPAGGNVCIRNVHPVVVFNRNVVLDDGLQKNIIIEKVGEPGKAVPGTWSYADQKNTIIFAAQGDCGGGPADCFDASTTYRLIFKDVSQIKAEGSPDLLLNCSLKANCKNPVIFTTGEGVDRQPPTIKFDAPDPNTPLPLGPPVAVKISFTDDNGVQNIALRADGFFVGSQSIGGCQKSGSVTITWPTAFVGAGLHNLDSTGYDWAANKGTANVKVTLRPPHCFNGVRDEDETGLDCGGSCGSCGGDKCSQDSDCSSGYCEAGVCVNRMRITNVSPLSSAPGDYVTVSGLFFGTTTGKIYFASTSVPTAQDWVEAKLAQCIGAPKFNNWIPWQILVEAPGLSAGIKGPVRVVTASTTVNGVERKFTDQTNDNFGPVISDFTFTNQPRPSLCAAIPETAPPATSIALVGKNLGTLGGKSQILFGTSRATVNALTKNGLPNWTPNLINEVFVPLLGPSVVGIAAFNADGLESNGIRFIVQAGISADSPIISSVTPTQGSRGEYITIMGKNFGVVPGDILFDDQKNLPIKGNFSFPPVCGSSYWQDNQIVVKFDQERGVFGTTYVVRVQTATGKVSLPDSNYAFSLQPGQPGPGICRIDPVSGPVPLGVGQKLMLSGEYFGTDPVPYFWKLGADPKTTAGRSPGVKTTTSTRDGADEASTTPQLGAISGPVVISRTEDKKISNPVSFTANDCTKQDTCSTLGEYRCCSSGVDVGLCKLKSELCAGETRATAYVWRFSTQDIVAVPRVVERCNSATDEGKNIPTPAPNIQWDGINDNGDHHRVCRNAVATVEFSTTMDQNTVNNTTVLLKKCKDVTGNNCTENGSVALDSDSFQLRTAFGGEGGSRQYLEIKPQVTPWENNTWYQVVVTDALKSTGGKVNLTIAKDKPCGNVKNSAYCFVFKTDDQDCKLKAVVVTPYAYWTQVLEQPIKYRVLNTVFGDLNYFGNGLSTQHCILMDMSGYDWTWAAADKQYADIFGPNTKRQAQASALANTVNVGVPNDSVDIKATASTNTPGGLVSKTGVSPLIIDLSKPEVFDYWPNCLEACTNADVGVQFTTQMSNVNVNWNSVRLYKCVDENCFSTVELKANATPSVLQANRFIITIPHDDFQPNSLYKVSLSSTSTPVVQLWSMGKLNDLNSKGAPYKQEFSWRFRTKKEACKIDRLSIDPKDYQARFLNDRAVYTVQPYSAPDACAAAGQRLNPWAVSWDWVSSDPAVATVQSFKTQGKNNLCTATCVKRGSTVPSGVGVLYPVCGNAIIEAGEDCDSPDKSKGCGLDCRFLGNQDPKTCGDGIVDPTKGEACDPGDEKTKIACSSDCRHLGSTFAPQSKDVNTSICGNGFIGSGEDCDLGISPDVTTPTSSLGCSDKCVHFGTRLSTKWCYDHGDKNGQAGDYGGFSKVDFNKICSLAYSQCGDGIVSPDEDKDCDKGNGQHEKWCNDVCLYNSSDKKQCTPKDEGCDANGQYLGSSLLYATPSVCGDTIVGVGEDPECEKNVTQDHVGLLDPWSLVIGVGQGKLQPNSKPPAQQTNITASTNQQTKGGGTVSGSGKFSIPCGYTTDAQCQAYYKSSDYGVGGDSCCYLKPKLQTVFPVDKSTKVCPNTYIEAVFNKRIDEVTLKGNLLIARGLLGTSSSSPTPVYKGFIDSQKDAQVKLSGATAVGVIGKYAYVTAELSNALEVVDISNPASPAHVTALQGQTFMSPTAVAVASQSYLYVGADNTFQIIDSNIADQTKPKLLGALKDGDVINQQTAHLKGSYHGIAVDGNQAYVTSFLNGGLDGTLQVIDASDKNKPVPVISFSNQDKVNGQAINLPGALAITVANGYAYVVGYGGYLQIIDVHDPGKPLTLGSLGGLGVIYGTPIVVGDIAYVASYSSNKLWIINVQDKNKPVIVGSLANGTDGSYLSNPTAVRVLGKYAFIISNDEQNKSGSVGLEIVDISSSTLPRHVMAVPTKKSQPYGVMIASDYVYVTAYSGGALEIIDVADFNPLNSNTCLEDVTNLITQAGGDVGTFPWYKRWLYYAIAFLKNVWSSTAGAANPAPSRWCVVGDVGTAQVVPRTTTTSSVFVRLTRPLAYATSYAVILKEGIRDTNGVRIGTSTIPNIKNINWRFETDSAICEVKGANIVPPEVLFSRVGASTTLEAKATTANGAFIQSIPGFYAWDYLWGPPDNPFVQVAVTTSSLATTTAKNRNGEIDVWAAARITNNIYTPTQGVVATGRSHITVLLCENPWPPKDLYYKGQGPFTILPYEDSEVNNDGYDTVSDTFSNIPILPSKVVTEPKNGYFHFSTYYCADNGSVGTFDDLPYFRSVVQVTPQELEYSTKGTCEVTGKSCSNDGNCGQAYSTTTYTTDYNLFIGDKDGGVCGGTAAAPPTIRYFADKNNQSMGCNFAIDCLARQEFQDWAGKNKLSPDCFSDGIKTVLHCQKFQPLKRWLFTNKNNTDVMGIQVFANPKHLSAEQWYKKEKVAGGQGFAGQVSSLQLAGYNAVSDGNNVYIDALNYSTTTESLFSNIYLFSINSDAQADTRQVFEQLLKNLKFNTNLTNFGYCGPSIDKPLFEQTCRTDIDCPAGQTCSAQVDKLLRNNQRLHDLQTVDRALESYVKNQKIYPNLKEGTYLTGQTFSVWSSWSVLGNALGTGLPTDPVNQLGMAGTCGTSTQFFGKFCVQDSDCPQLNNATTTCVLHDPATGWSTADRRFSFACASSSYAYRYIFSTTTGYTFKSHFEDAVPLSKDSFTGFINGFGFSTTTRFGLSGTTFPANICAGDQEISTLNQGTCGDGQINWGRGEQCDPPGYKLYDKSTCQNNPNGSYTIKECDATCLWKAPQSIACKNLAKCGNGKIEPGEVCDDGRLNDTYNHCNAQCTGLVAPQGNGSPGYCGDNKVNPQNELCDVGNKICFGGINDKQPCQKAAQCNEEFTLNNPQINQGKTNLAVVICQIVNNPPPDYKCQVLDFNFQFGLATLDLSSCKGSNCDLAFDAPTAQMFGLGQDAVKVPVEVNWSKCASDPAKVKNGLLYGYNKKTDSCNFDCQSYGPYCGDGVVQDEFGEDCDGNQSCTIDGHNGQRLCNLCSATDAATLVGWWKLDENSKIFIDSSGKNNVGGCTNNDCPIFIAQGKTRGAAQFDSSSFIKIDHSPSLDFKTVTIEAWVKTAKAGYQSGIHSFIKKQKARYDGANQLDDIDFQLEYYHNVSNGQITAVRLDSGVFGGVTADLVTPFEPGEWHHLAVTIDDQKQIKFFADGELLTNVTRVYPLGGSRPIANGNFPIFIGGQLDDGSAIDEVKIYNRALVAGEIKDHFAHNWVCQVNDLKELSVATPGTCGDGVVDQNTEVCDRGKANNGIACAPSYGKSCSYCSVDCKHVIDVQPTEYCGDGTINGSEVCDTDNSVSPTVLYARDKDTTSTEQNLTNRGYKVRACVEEPQPFYVNKLNQSYSQTFAKGTKTCVNNCSKIIVKETGTNSCVVCGIDPNGVSINGNILNVLEPQSNDPLYMALEKAYLDIISPNIAMGLFHVENHAVTNVSSFINLDYKTPSTFNSNSLCSIGTPRYQALLQYDPNPSHIFDFPIVSKPQPWQYDLILSPVMSADGLKDSKTNPLPQSATPDNVRVVVSWLGVGGADFIGGFVGFDAQQNSFTYEGPSLMPTQGTNYYTQPPSKKFSDIWYHGFGQTAGGINEAAFTVNTKQMPLDFYSFYVRSPGSNFPLKKFKSLVKLKVDIYLPDNDGVVPFNLFARPYKTFTLDAADFSTQNPAANYWQVFNLVFGQDPGQCIQQGNSIFCEPGKDISLVRRIVPVNKIITAPESFSH